MEKQVDQLTEKEVQCLIADYPWLLNLDYEIIPELKNKGMEYQLTENKRADLILKDRKSGRPVIVEFKAVPFYRENIGQILEYRARILNEYSSDNSQLKEIFKEQMFSPILLLVVPTCSAEARLACNLSGIEIYEYSKTVPEIIVPERRKTLDEFVSEMKKYDLPFTAERCEHIDEIYEQIHAVLTEENLSFGWKNYRNPTGEYFVSLNHLFINKNIFSDWDISIGICENVFDSLDQIVVEFYSNSFDLLNDFREEYIKSKFEPKNDKEIDKSTYDGCCWSFYIDKKKFINDVENSIKPYIHNYMTIMSKLNLIG